MIVFPRGRAVEPDRIIDLEEFARWVQDHRNENGWSLEILARHISDAGYPISQNKLYRIEQHLKEKADQKRPLMTIDYELKMRLESVFGERFTPSAEHDAGDDEVVSVNKVIEIIHDLKNNKLASRPPADPVLERIHIALKEAFSAGT